MESAVFSSDLFSTVPSQVQKQTEPLPFGREVHVYWEEAGGFYRGHIKPVNVHYRGRVYELFSGDEYRWHSKTMKKRRR